MGHVDPPPNQSDAIGACVALADPAQMLPTIPNLIASPDMIFLRTNGRFVGKRLPVCTGAGTTGTRDRPCGSPRAHAITRRKVRATDQPQDSSIGDPAIKERYQPFAVNGIE